MAQDSLQAAENSRVIMKNGLFFVKNTAKELQAAASDIARGAQAIGQISGEARTAIEALGQAPEEQTRAAAWRKIEPIIDAGKAIGMRADAALAELKNPARRR